MIIHDVGGSGPLIKHVADILFPIPVDGEKIAAFFAVSDKAVDTAVDFRFPDSMEEGKTLWMAIDFLEDAFCHFVDAESVSVEGREYQQFPFSIAVEVKIQNITGRSLQQQLASPV